MKMTQSKSSAMLGIPSHQERNLPQNEFNLALNYSLHQLLNEKENNKNLGNVYDSIGGPSKGPQVKGNPFGRGMLKNQENQGRESQKEFVSHSFAYF